MYSVLFRESTFTTFTATSRYKFEYWETEIFVQLCLQMPTPNLRVFFFTIII